jgi:hypothetical protein
VQSQNPVSSPIEQVGAAVVQTAVAPTPEQIVADIQTALNLFLEFKAIGASYAFSER